MKKSKLLIIGIVLLSILIVSCHKGRNKLISSWKVTNVEAKKSLSDSLKNIILSKGNLTFSKDGKAIGYLETEMDGTYILSEGGKKLVIMDETGTPYPFASTIENDRLVLDGEEMKLTLVEK